MGYLQLIMAKVDAETADLRRHAVEDLTQNDQPESVLDLLVALRDPSIRVREAAADVLATLKPHSVCPYLAALLTSDDASLRGYVTEVLEAFGPAVEGQLIEATKSADQDVRKFALDALVKNAKKYGDHSDAARQVIKICLNDSNVNVAGSAVEALGWTKNRDYLPLLEAVLKSDSPWLQCAAIGSIIRLTGDHAEDYFARIDRSTLSEEGQAYLDAVLPVEVAC